MESTKQENFQTTVASRIAGEDIHPNDFITLSSEVIEMPSYMWCTDSSSIPREELVRLRYLPRDSGVPFKVIAVCLPFVYAKSANDKIATFDTRKHQLAKLDQACGKKVWKQMQSKASFQV